MANSTSFDQIDANQIATARQVYGVACHFANIHAKSPSERYGLTKVFNAVLNKHYKDSDSFMTHGDVSEYRDWDCVPPQFLHMISKPKKAKKATAKATAQEKVTLTQRVDSLESKMDKILEILSAK